MESKALDRPNYLSQYDLSIFICFCLQAMQHRQLSLESPEPLHYQHRGSGAIGNEHLKKCNKAIHFSSFVYFVCLFVAFVCFFLIIDESGMIQNSRVQSPHQ